MINAHSANNFLCLVELLLLQVQCQAEEKHNGIPADAETAGKQDTDLETDLAAMDCFRSFSDMAAELDTSEIILRYKLEALRIREYDLDTLELESYNKVFKDII